MIKTPFANYITGSSVLYKAKPGIKLFCLTILISAALITQTWTELIPVILVTAIATIAAGFTFREAAVNMWSFSLLYVVTFILHCLLTDGDIWFSLPFGMNITQQGIFRGLFFSLKIMLLVTLFSAVMRTTHQSEWSNVFDVSSSNSKSLRRFLAPLALTIGVAIRFLPLIMQETERIRISQISRGYTRQGGIIKRIQSIGDLLAPLLISTFDRVDTIADAMQVRGFRLGMQRNAYLKRGLSAVDYSVLGITLVTLLFVIL